MISEVNETVYLVLGYIPKLFKETCFEIINEIIDTKNTTFFPQLCQIKVVPPSKKNHENGSLWESKPYPENAASVLSRE